jgi:hypothetical protein
MVIVPNARLASSVVTNYGQPEPEMSVLVEQPAEWWRAPAGAGVARRDGQ